MFKLKRKYKYLVAYSFVHTESYTLIDGSSHVSDNGGTGSAYIDIDYKIKTLEDINITEKFLLDRLTIDNLKSVNITSFTLIKK